MEYGRGNVMMVFGVELQQARGREMRWRMWSKGG